MHTLNLLCISSSSIASLTKQAHNALRGFKESNSVDASVGDRNVREGLLDLSIWGLQSGRFSLTLTVSR